MADFAERLRALRAAEDLTQGSLAAALDVSIGSVQGWERGANLPEALALIRLGETFPEWSIDYLLGLTSERAPNRPEVEQRAMRAAAASLDISRGRKRRRSRSDGPRSAPGNAR